MLTEFGEEDLFDEGKGLLELVEFCLGTVL